MKTVKINWENKGICRITFDRPKVKNSFNDEMIEDFQIGLEKVKNDKDLRILIISGSGDSFSSGADLNWMKNSLNYTLEENINDARKFANILKTIYNIPRPTIAKINGHSFGGGLGIIAACDFAIAIEDTKFSFSEVRLGLTPAMISPYVLKSIGFNNARRLFLTGEIFDARKALEINLLSKVVANLDLDKEVDKLSNDLLKGAPNAQGECKSILSHISEHNIEQDLIDFTIKKIATRRVSKEGKEGMISFFDKKDPSWKL